MIIDFELKPKGLPAVRASFEATSWEQAAQEVRAAQEAFGLLAEPPKRPRLVKTEATAAGAPQTEVTAQDHPSAAPTRARAKRFDDGLNKAAIEKAELAALLIPELEGKEPYDLVKSIGFQKPMAEMAVSDLQAVINALDGVISTYCAAQPSAQAFLEIRRVIEDATSLDDLAARKNGFTKWKELSADARLFNAAKAFCEQKTILLETAADLAEAS